MATIHATAVLVGARAVLIQGPPGSGKSGLALALLQAEQGRALPFACLVGDDRVHVEPVHGRLLVRPAAPLAGQIEVRGVGGLKDDLPKGFIEDCRAVMRKIRTFCDENDDLLIGNEIFQKRTRGVGILTMPHEPVAVVGLVVDLAAADAERLPEPNQQQTAIAGVTLPRLAVAAGTDPLPLLLAWLGTGPAAV